MQPVPTREGEEFYETPRFPEPPPARFDGQGPHRHPEAAQQADADHLGLHSTGDASRLRRATIVPHPSFQGGRSMCALPSLQLENHISGSVGSPHRNCLFFGLREDPPQCKEPTSASRTWERSASYTLLSSRERGEPDGRG